MYWTPAVQLTPFATCKHTRVVCPIRISELALEGLTQPDHAADGGDGADMGAVVTLAAETTESSRPHKKTVTTTA